MPTPQEPFSRGDSFLHRLDPAAKVASALVLAVSMALARTWPAALAGVGVGLVLALAARLPLAPLLKRLAVVNLFVLFLWVVLPLTPDGPVLASLGPVSIHAGGLELAWLITLKCNGIVLTLTALTATSPLALTGRALQRLGVPAKLCWLILFTYRYLFVIGEEHSRLVRAARMRGFRPRTNLFTWKIHANLFAMTLVKSWNRSQRVGQAMLLRGFSGRFHTLGTERFGATGTILTLTCLACALGLAFWDMTL